MPTIYTLRSCEKCGNEHINFKYCSHKCANSRNRAFSAKGEIEIIGNNGNRLWLYKFETKPELIEILKSYDGFGGYAIVRFKDAQ